MPRGYPTLKRFTGILHFAKQSGGGWPHDLPFEIMAYGDVSLGRALDELVIKSGGNIDYGYTLMYRKHYI